MIRNFNPTTAQITFSFLFSPDASQPGLMTMYIHVWACRRVQVVWNEPVNFSLFGFILHFSGLPFQEIVTASLLSVWWVCASTQCHFDFFLLLIALLHLLLEAGSAGQQQTRRSTLRSTDSEKGKFIFGGWERLRSGEWKKGSSTTTRTAT